jgi:hypothetical protein
MMTSIKKSFYKDDGFAAVGTDYPAEVYISPSQFPIPRSFTRTHFTVN